MAATARADLAAANLAGADLARADLAGAIKIPAEEIPIVPQIDAKILAAIEAAASST